MITVLSLFELPEDITREQLMQKYRQSAPKWNKNPDLIRKNYIYDPASNQGGGVYVWKNRAAAERWLDDGYREMIRKVYGSEPVIRYFDTLIGVDNEYTNEIIEIDKESGSNAE